MNFISPGDNSVQFPVKKRMESIKANINNKTQANILPADGDVYDIKKRYSDWGYLSDFGLIGFMIPLLRRKWTSQSWNFDFDRILKRK